MIRYLKNIYITKIISKHITNKKQLVNLIHSCGPTSTMSLYFLIISSSSAILRISSSSRSRIAASISCFFVSFFGLTFAFDEERELLLFLTTFDDENDLLEDVAALVLFLGSRSRCNLAASGS